jgi:hypothetical protein
MKRAAGVRINKMPFVFLGIIVLGFAICLYTNTNIIEGQGYTQGELEIFDKFKTGLQSFVKGNEMLDAHIKTIPTIETDRLEYMQDVHQTVKTIIDRIYDDANQLGVRMSNRRRAKADAAANTAPPAITTKNASAPYNDDKAPK